MNANFYGTDYPDDNEENYFNELKVPIPLELLHIFMLFDIDGVVCDAGQSHLDDIQMNPEEYNKMIGKRSCLPIFLNTIQKIIDYNCKYTKYNLGSITDNIPIELGFLTGRKMYSQFETEQMFSRSKLGWVHNRIIYYPNDLTWGTTDYLTFKTQQIQNLMKKHSNRLFKYFDDNEPLITHLQQVFKNNYQIKLFLIQNKKNN